MKRVVFINEGVLQVVRLGVTSNAKIMSSNKEKMVQTYAFDLDQVSSAIDPKSNLREFFGKADKNCLDCPMRDYGKCYTHKFTQARGFLSMLKSIVKEFGSIDQVPEYSEQIFNDAVEMCRGRFVRFGTYGEPVLHGIDLVKAMVSVAKSHTGYTHQWMRLPEFAPFFMASVHSVRGEEIAREMGYRSFMSADTKPEGLVGCPASKEGGFKSSCDKCGLCSGTDGKGKKSVFILNH
jgi:hypothetical protein